MQLFGLVNSMLANDRTTAERDLSIARYAVIPLSPNSGLIGWVPNTDTLHALIRYLALVAELAIMYSHAHKMHTLQTDAVWHGTQGVMCLAVVRRAVSDAACTHS